MYVQIMDITTGDIVKAFDNIEEADEWVYMQEFPNNYEAIVEG